MMFENRRYSLRELAHELNTFHESVCAIFVDVLGMRRVAARLVPKEPNFLQREHRNQV